MKATDPVCGLLSQFFGQQNTISVPRALVRAVGDLKAAILLSQIIYWHRITNNATGWFYKTYQDWNDELALTKNEVNRASKVLQDLGLIKIDVRPVKNSPVTHYQFQEFAFSQWIRDFWKAEIEPVRFLETRNQAPENQKSISGNQKSDLSNQHINQELQDQFSPITTVDYSEDYLFPHDPKQTTKSTPKFVEIWNTMVPESKVRWKPTDKPPKDWQDPEFIQNFETICHKAAAIRQARPDATWLTFRSLFTNDRNHQRKWQKLLEGVYDFLLSDGKPPKQEVDYPWLTN